jgi:hypothetical protein
MQHNTAQLSRTQHMEFALVVRSSRISRLHTPVVSNDVASSSEVAATSSSNVAPANDVATTSAIHVASSREVAATSHRDMAAMSSGDVAKSGNVAATSSSNVAPAGWCRQAPSRCRGNHANRRRRCRRDCGPAALVLATAPTTQCTCAQHTQ